MLNHRGSLALFGGEDAGAAIPVAAIELVIDLDDVFTGGGDDAARVEHHAGDGVFVAVRVVDDAAAEIPYLDELVVLFYKECFTKGMGVTYSNASVHGSGN